MKKTYYIKFGDYKGNIAIDNKDLKYEEDFKPSKKGLVSIQLESGIHFIETGACAAGNGFLSNIYFVVTQEGKILKPKSKSIKLIGDNTLELVTKEVCINKGDYRGWYYLSSFHKDYRHNNDQLRVEKYHLIIDVLYSLDNGTFVGYPDGTASNTGFAVDSKGRFVSLSSSTKVNENGELELKFNEVKSFNPWDIFYISKDTEIYFSNYHVVLTYAKDANKPFLFIKGLLTNIMWVKDNVGQFKYFIPSELKKGKIKILENKYGWSTLLPIDFKKQKKNSIK